MQLALDGVADLAAPFVAAGFSNGGGMAEFVTTSRGGSAGGVAGCLQFSGALPLAMLGLPGWPAATPVQLHYSTDDPFRNQEWVAAYLDEVRDSGSELETFLDYPIAGHLFTDESLPDEYDEASASCFSPSPRVPQLEAEVIHESQQAECPDRPGSTPVGCDQCSQGGCGAVAMILLEAAAQAVPVELQHHAVPGLARSAVVVAFERKTGTADGQHRRGRHRGHHRGDLPPAQRPAGMPGRPCARRAAVAAMGRRYLGPHTGSRPRRRFRTVKQSSVGCETAQMRAGSV